MAKIENIYTSVACNRTSNSLDWSLDNRIAFAAKNSIGIYEQNEVRNIFIRYALKKILIQKIYLPAKFMEDIKTISTTQRSCKCC